MGHVARNIVNAHHRQTKEPLNLFFVDLEPADNNKDVYNITALQNKIILIEPPQVNKKHVPQCVRCQQYGHKRTYCNKPYACVKCGGCHNSSDCVKQKTRRRNVPCAEETTQLTTKAVNTTTTLSKETTPTEPPQ